LYQLLLGLGVAGGLVTHFIKNKIKVKERSNQNQLQHQLKLYLRLIEEVILMHHDL